MKNTFEYYNVYIFIIIKVGNNKNEEEEYMEDSEGTDIENIDSDEEDLIDMQDLI